MATQTTDTTEVAQSRLVAELGHIDAIAFAEPLGRGAKAKLDGRIGAIDIARIRMLGYRVGGVSSVTGMVYFHLDL